MPALSAAMNFESSTSSSQVSSPASVAPTVQLSPPTELQAASSPEFVEEAPPEPRAAQVQNHQEPSLGLSRQLQVIDENQNFSPKLTQYMNDIWNLGDAGFNYNLVAVFGSQSTGKSNEHFRQELIARYAAQRTVQYRIRYDDRLFPPADNSRALDEPGQKLKYPSDGRGGR